MGSGRFDTFSELVPDLFWSHVILHDLQACYPNLTAIASHIVMRRKKRSAIWELARAHNISKRETVVSALSFALSSVSKYRKSAAVGQKSKNLRPITKNPTFM